MEALSFVFDLLFIIFSLYLLYAIPRSRIFGYLIMLVPFIFIPYFIYLFFKSFNNIFIPLIILFVFLIIFIFIYERYVRRSIDDIGFFRDIPNKYTPLEVSYLVNNKIEMQKDFVSVFLKLINKGIISFNNSKYGYELKLEKYNLIEEVDEKYVVDWYFNKNNKKYNLDELEKIIFKKLSNKNIYKNKERVPFVVIIALIVVTIFSIYAYFAFNGYCDFDAYMDRVCILGIIGIWMVFSFNKYTVKPIYKFTDYGKNEYKIILSFKHFLISFSNIAKKQLASNKLWGDYLAYSTVLDVNTEYMKINDNILNKVINDEFSRKINQNADKISSINRRYY